MFWYQNPLLRPYIQSELKKTNQRIAQIGKTYGKTSSTYKHAIAAFQKGPLSEFLGTSASGNVKLDIRKIQKAIHSGQLNRSEANELLARAAGLRIDENGDIDHIKVRKKGKDGKTHEVDQGGDIKTVSEIRERTKKKMINTYGEDPRDYTTKEIDEFGEALEEFSDTFQTAYNEAIAAVGESALKDDPVTAKLWGENRTAPGKKKGTKILTPNDIVQIQKRLNELRKEGVDIVADLEKEEDIIKKEPEMSKLEMLLKKHK